MDDRVKKAMQRWPNVPAAYGWLRLDRRGQWFLIDRNTPGFDEATHGRGSLLQNPQLSDFINRNYQADHHGGWYWQNGPQRAYADLDTAPLILRAMQDKTGQATTALMTHTGDLVEEVSRVCLDDNGVLFLVTEHGPCSMHDLDLASLALTDTHLDWGGHSHRIEYLDHPADQALGFQRQPRGD
jgi:hypothetical protein